MKNGFSIRAVKTKDFNKMVLNGSLKDRAITSDFYLQINKDYSLRQYGWNAFSYNNSFWGRTKKEAIEKAIKHNA